MIVSIYLEEHGFLIDKPQTFNFGGEYLYSFLTSGADLIIRRKPNEKYIPDFFNISGSKCNVKLLSAIVGENGVGKSSFLNVIRKAFVEHVNSMPHSIATILVEDEGELKVLFSNSHNRRIYFANEDSEKDDSEVLEDFLLKDLNYPTREKVSFSEIEKTSNNYQSIYYSPHFDLKYNPNFDEVDKYDISLDQFIKGDLEDIDKKGTNENGFNFPFHEELVFNNTLRQVEFMISDFFKKNEVIEYFKLPVYENLVILFRNIQIPDNDFWNTPNQFRGWITRIKEKTSSEIKNWHTFRKFDANKNVSNQPDINKYILRRFIIDSILTVIIHMMEERNSFLNEGVIDININDEKTAEELFLSFIDEAYISISGKKKKIFDSDLYNKFFEELNKIIAKDLDDYQVKNQSIIVKIDEVENLIKLHREIVHGFFNYYSYYDNLSRKSLNYYQFIGLEPFRNMSSGENALLNFFSKLYSFIHNNLTEKSKSLPDKDNYIILLDEADLGFHPIWKKKYIDAILKMIPYFFESLSIKPRLQIIITTHDPLTLSDLPINNVVFLKKDGDYCSVISDTDQNKIQKTFGANITNLLAHSFFVENGLIGDFSKSKIKEVIDWINSHKKNIKNIDKKSTSEFKEKIEYYKKVINLIDEKVIKIKLTEMITELMPDNEYYNQVIDKEIELLKSKKK